MPGKKLPGELGASKNQFISDRLDAFQNLISQSGFMLSNQIFKNFLDQLDIVSGTISNSNDNLRRVSLVDKAFQVFNETQGIRILSTFANDIKDILKLGKEYYVETVGNQAEENQIQQIIYRQLGIGSDGAPRSGGYLDKLTSDPSMQAELKQIVFQQVSSNAVGYNDLKNTISNFIEGTGQNPGAFYKHYERFAFDTYSEVDRLNSKLHADRLGLTNFLYNGGLVKDSRVFCIHNNGKVFTIKEAQEWKLIVNKVEFRPGKKGNLVKVVVGPIVAKGMESSYDPVTMLGGIKCRHSADFISDEVAAFLKGKQSKK